MKILLANSPWIIGSNRYGVRAGSRWPFTIELSNNGQRDYVPFPFFLAYTASLLKKYGNEAVIIDAVAEGIGEDSFVERIKDYAPQIVVFETTTPSFRNDIRIAEKVKQNLKSAKIVFCGPHAGVFPLEILSKYMLIDYILIGEYEYTLLELVTYFEKGLNLKDVLGLAYREENEVRLNDPRPTIKDLNSLPWPERQTLSMYKYNDGFCSLPKPNVQMLASRGCPYQCMFCLWPQTIYREHKYRKRNAVDVVDEMEWLIKSFNFKAVYFDDDVFNIDRSFILDICKEIKKRKIKIPWSAMARADLMDEEFLELMYSAGLYAIKYGIESANQNILNFCKKNMDLNRARLTIKFTKKLGVRVHLTFCLGLPGETNQTIQRTVRFIQDVKPHSLQFSFATPFPGTVYFNYVRDKGWLFSGDWSDYDGNYKCIVKTEELSSEDLERIKIAFNSNFNL